DTGVGVPQLGYFGGQLTGVLLLAHADRAFTATVEELLHDRFGRGEQHFPGTEHHEVAAEEHTDVVRHGAGGVDVVGDDQEGGVDLRVQVDDQLVQVGRADRVQTGVRFVEQDDLGVQHQRSGQAGALAHTAGNLAGKFFLGSDESDHLHLL